MVTLSSGLPDIETATTDQTLPLVKNELGLAFLPEPMVTDALQNNSVVSLKLREALPTRQVSIVYDQTHPMSMAAHRLLELLIHDKIFRSTDNKQDAPDKNPKHLLFR